MRRVALAAAFVLLRTLAPAAGQPPSPPALRVVTYNIHHGEGMDGIFDLSRVAAVIMREKPDLVALQEVDEATTRSGGVNQADVLASLTGMHMTFGKAMDFEGGQYGILVLSRWPILHVDRQPLPRAEDGEPRIALSVDVDPPEIGRRVRFSTTHLDQGRDATNRILQAAALNQLLARDNDDVPTILAGDLNSRADSEVMEKLRSLWTDMFTAPAPIDPLERPRYRVDYVLARPGNRWRSLESRAIDTPNVSDHWPVLDVLELLGIS